MKDDDIKCDGPAVGNTLGTAEVSVGSACAYVDRECTWDCTSFCWRPDHHEDGNVGWCGRLLADVWLPLARAGVQWRGDYPVLPDNADAP